MMHDANVSTRATYHTIIVVVVVVMVVMVSTMQMVKE